ncbi:MAG: hypothetical protein ACLVIJ_06260 [Clostridium sp.]|jgi:hypothetical protein|nr:hypothetical protein [Eubacterium sp.]
MKGDKMRKKGKLIISCCILFGIMLFIGLAYWILIFIPRERMKGCYFGYEQMPIMSNEKYTGKIDAKMEHILIEDHAGTKVTELDLLGNSPDQVVLGEKTFFLLYRWDDQKGTGKIVQYDYNSNKLKECRVPNVATIAWKDNYLFLGNWDLKDDYRYYFESYYKGFYANRYIEEEKFGKQPKKIIKNHDWGCKIGNTKMYYHEEGFFSTEPSWLDYAGTSMGNFTLDDVKSNYQAETKQEKINRTLLVKEIGQCGISNPNYLIVEYQMGDKIYGVCNVLREYIPAYPIESKDVVMACCYKISKKNNKLKILKKQSSSIAIIAENDEFVYQTDNRIIRNNLKTGDTQTIFTFSKYFSANIDVQGDYLHIYEGDRSSYIKWT